MAGIRLHGEHDTDGSGISANVRNAARERAGTCEPANKTIGACVSPGLYEADAERVKTAGGSGEYVKDSEIAW